MLSTSCLQDVLYRQITATNGNSSLLPEQQRCGTFTKQNPAVTNSMEHLNI
jgi:hypothetical protein